MPPFTLCVYNVHVFESYVEFEDVLFQLHCTGADSY